MTASRFARGAMTAVLACAIVSAGIHVDADAPIEPGPAVPQSVPTSKRLYMITDSVGLGAEYAIPRAFGAQWQITIDGDPGEFTETLESKYVRPRLTLTPGVFGDYAVVASGYNYPYWDKPRFDRSVDTMIETLERAGVKHVFWVTLREIKPQYISGAAWRQIQPYYWYFPDVNDRLELALARHPNLSLIDFAAVADQPGITYDAIHLNNLGADLYAAITRQAVIDATTAVPDGSTTRIAVPDAAGVEAVALNLTTVDPRTAAYLTAYDCDQPRPLVSNHNYVRDEIVAHSAIVPVSAGGEVCVYNHTGTNLVVDITGRFRAEAAITGTRSTRLVDTRDRGSRQAALDPLVVDVIDGDGIPAPVALSVTAVDAAGPGWLRAGPCDATGTTSTVNMMGAPPVPNVAVVTPTADGRVCITSSIATHILVDRLVTFGESSGLRTVTPDRVLDTRDEAAAGDGRRLAAGGVAVLHGDQLGVGPDTTGVMLNLTATEALGAGFLTAYPCAAGRPDTSNLNYVPWTVVANFVVVQPDVDGDVCVFASNPTHVVVDLLGTTAAGFVGGAPKRLLDTRIANLPPNWP
jgi:hypothetical protein